MYLFPCFMIRKKNRFIISVFLFCAICLGHNVTTVAKNKIDSTTQVKSKEKHVPVNKTIQILLKTVETHLWKKIVPKIFINLIISIILSFVLAYIYKQPILFFIVLCVYTTILVTWYFITKYIVLLPPKIKKNVLQLQEPYSLANGLDKNPKIVYYKSFDGTVLGGLYHEKKRIEKNKNMDTRQVMLIYHGSNTEPFRMYDWMQDFGEKNNCDIVVASYRGFGFSEGRLAKEYDFYKDVIAAYHCLLHVGYKEENITVMGISLGTVAASWLGAFFKPRRLILKSPFPKLDAIVIDKMCEWFYLPYWISKLMVDSIFFFSFNTEIILNRISMPTLIIYSEKDRVVPCTHTQEYMKKLSEAKNIEVEVFIYEGKHRDSPQSIDNRLTQFMKQL